MKPRKTVIVITPSESLRNQYALQMDVWGYRTLLPATMDDAMDMVRAEQPDAVLCDRMADGMIQQLAAAAPERTGFVLVTETGRKIQNFNAILRERVANAATRKPGPKKDSASVAKTALATGTHAVIALLLSITVLQFFVGLWRRDALRFNQKRGNLVIRHGCQDPTAFDGLGDVLCLRAMANAGEAVFQTRTVQCDHHPHGLFAGKMGNQVHSIERRVELGLNDFNLRHEKSFYVHRRAIDAGMSMSFLAGFRAGRIQRATNTMKHTTAACGLALLFGSHYVFREKEFDIIHRSWVGHIFLVNIATSSRTESALIAPSMRGFIFRRQPKFIDFEIVVAGKEASSHSKRGNGNGNRADASGGMYRYLQGWTKPDILYFEKSPLHGCIDLDRTVRSAIPNEFKHRHRSPVATQDGLLDSLPIHFDCFDSRGNGPADSQKSNSASYGLNPVSRFAHADTVAPERAA